MVKSVHRVQLVSHFVLLQHEEVTQPFPLLDLEADAALQDAFALDLLCLDRALYLTNLVFEAPLCREKVNDAHFEAFFRRLSFFFEI